MQDLKFGDKVQVFYEESWCERTFITYSKKRKGIIVVKEKDEQYFKDGIGFDTIFYSNDKWQKI